MVDRSTTADPRGGGPHRVGLGGLGSLLLLAAVLLAVAQLPPAALETVAIAASYAAALVCFVVSRRGTGRRRRAWLGFAVLLLVWSSADVLWVLVDLGLVTDRISVADLVYLAGVPGAVVGVLLLPDGTWERGSRFRVALDAVVVAIPVLVVGDVLVVRQLGGEPLSAAQAWLVVWPVVDVLLTALAFVLVRRRREPLRPDLALVVLAFASWTVGDTWLAWLAMSDREYFGSLAQLPFMLGPLLLALAALASPQARGLTPAQAAAGVRRHATSRVVVVLPDLLVISAGLVCLVVELRHWHEWVLVGLGAGLAVVRHSLVAVDAQHLRETLEGRVAQRTHRLRAVSERLELILSSVGDGIVGVSADGRITFVNRAAACLLGVTPDDLLGLDACEALCSSQHLDCPLALAARVGDRDHRIEMTFRRRPGGLLPVEVGVTALGSETDGDLGSVLVFHDVSARRAVEQTKRQFVSSVSHELRTPLTAIRGALEMLVDGDGGELPPAASHLVETAERGTNRLTRLVDDLLDVDRLASGTFSVQARPTPVAPVVGDVVATLADWAAHHGVTLRTGPLVGVALADPDRVEQALVNLVGNAVKFSPPGATVHLSARELATAVELEVRDEGRGIPASDLPHVFERFHQVDEGDATEKGGTGLGLAITRSIVQRHGGEIWVESTPGLGSTFRFTLPRGDDPAPYVDPSPASAREPEAVPGG